MKMIGNTTCGRKTFVNGDKTGPVNFALSPILEGKARRLCNWMQSGVLIKWTNPVGYASGEKRKGACSKGEPI